MRFWVGIILSTCLIAIPADAVGQNRDNPFGFSENAKSRPIPFFGNPAKGKDKEAQSMSPPDWGEEFEALPGETDQVEDGNSQNPNPKKRNRLQDDEEPSEMPPEAPPVDRKQSLPRQKDNQFRPAQPPTNKPNRIPIGHPEPPAIEVTSTQNVWPSKIESKDARSTQQATSPASTQIDFSSNADPARSNDTKEFTFSPFPKPVFQQPDSATREPASKDVPSQQTGFVPAAKQQSVLQDPVIQPPGVTESQDYPPGDSKPFQVYPGSGNRVPFDKGYRADGYAGSDLSYLDDGQAFPHETKKQYPPMREILRTGRYFANAEWRTFQPHFHNNTALNVSSAANASSHQFDWGYESTPLFRAGFESKYGPGVELDYWQYDHESQPVIATSNGVELVSASLPNRDANGFGDISTSTAGESISARHALELHSVGASFFKEMKMPISRLNGAFGIRYVSLAHYAQAELRDVGQTSLGRVEHITDFRGFGPRIKLEYFRPVGHTKLESIGTFGSSVLFGNRDQFVENTIGGDFYRTNADEFITVIEAGAGVQYVRQTAECRNFYLRLMYQSQTWIGGGTGASLDDSFGFRGLGITLGVNR